MANSPRDENRTVAIGGKGDVTGAFVPANINEATGDFTFSLDGEEVQTKSATGINGGDVSVGTTEVEITFTGTTRSMMIQSKSTNTGSIWIGLTGVTNSGGNAFVQLEPGDGVTFKLNDASAALYAISDTAAQTVYKVALT